MKNIGASLLAGLVVAFGGLFVSDFVGNLFNGMEYGSACVLGVCLYLCVVVVTCTGIIVAKIDQNARPDENTHPEKTDNRKSD